jgi:hypothetical protein
MSDTGIIATLYPRDYDALLLGARLYWPFNNRHLEPLSSETVGADGVYLLVRTSQSCDRLSRHAPTRSFPRVPAPCHSGEGIVAARDLLHRAIL